MRSSAARTEDLPAPDELGLTLRRSVGAWTRFTALRGDETLGFLELDTDLTEGGRLAAFARWADVGNLWVEEQHRRTGVGSWLLGQGAEWLRLAGIRHLVAYAWPEQEERLAFYAATGFRELVTTERGWVRTS